MGVDPFVSRNVGGTRIGLPHMTSGRDAACEAAVLFANALAVSSFRLAWPPLHEIALTFTHGIDTEENGA